MNGQQPSPSDQPEDGPASGGRMEDLEKLVSGMGWFLTQVAKRLGQAATLVSGLAAAIGLIALLLGVWAWHGSTAALVFVAVICVPAIVIPLFVMKRIKPITAAVEHPDETARQARDYFAGLQSTPQLNQLVHEAVGIQRGSGTVRLRGAFRGFRLISSLIDSVSPDPTTQPLVAAFHPARLRGLWLAVIASWWLALLATLIAAVAAVSVIANKLT